MKIRLLLLDREFFNFETVRYLKRAHDPFLMPVTRRGRRPKSPDIAWPWRFWTWKRSGWGTHRLTNEGKTSEVKVCVSLGNLSGRFRKRGRRRFVYAYWGIKPTSIARLRNTYRRRFGIESSYRQMNEARIRTCTRKPILRLLIAGLALLLRNVWVWIHRTLLAEHRGGHLRLHLEQLRFGALLLHLQHYAEAFLGLTEMLMQPRPPT